jgi:lipopolysaccharide export system protein LptC
MWLWVALFFACKDSKPDVKKSNIPAFNFLSGYWIPKEITWGGDGLNTKDTGDVFRVASFKTLCFDTAGRFIYFSSTQRRPKNYGDSIIFAGEPIVKMYKGNWSFDDALLNVSYKVVPEGSTVADSIAKHEGIRIVYSATDTMLIFQNKLYVRTDKYDKISRSTIESYKRSN